jgi:hypothetical protein
LEESKRWSERKSERVCERETILIRFGGTKEDDVICGESARFVKAAERDLPRKWNTERFSAENARFGKSQE